MPTTRRSQAERSPVAGEKRGPRTPTSVEKAAQEKRVASVPVVEPVARRASRSTSARIHEAAVGNEGAAEASIGNASDDALAAAEQLLGFGEAARGCEPPPAPPPLAPLPPDPPLADASGGGTELFNDGLEMLRCAAAGEVLGALPARPPRVKQRVPRPPELDHPGAPPELAIDDQDDEGWVHVVTRLPRVSPPPTHAISRTQSSSSSSHWRPFTSLGHTQGARQGRSMVPATAGVAGNAASNAKQGTGNPGVRSRAGYPMPVGWEAAFSAGQEKYKRPNGKGGTEFVRGGWKEVRLHLEESGAWDQALYDRLTSATAPANPSYRRSTPGARQAEAEAEANAAQRAQRGDSGEIGEEEGEEREDGEEGDEEQRRAKIYRKKVPRDTDRSQLTLLMTTDDHR
jgi:hypothetical protein